MRPSDDDSETSERHTMNDWAYAAALIGVALALAALIVGVLFLVDVLVKGWPK